MPMKPDLPDWAFQPATPADHARASDAHRRGQLRLQWPDRQALRDWAKAHGWPAPWLGFEAAFTERLLISPENFALALAGSGLAVSVPRRDYSLPAETLARLDALYTERSADQRPTQWGSLVAELRAIRRAVEAGVRVTIPDVPALRSWQDFYAWAHGRYHSLEDGYDDWIGNDE